MVVKEHSYVPERFFLDSQNHFALSIRDQMKDRTIADHPLYPKSASKKSRTQVETLKDALESEDSSLKYYRFDPADKEGILEDSEEWYFDKMIIVNEAGHTDQADWLNPRAKL